MRNVFTIAILVLLFGTVAAQQGENSFTLDQCIRYAIENSVSLQNSRIDEEIADSRVKETIGLGLPQVSASVGIQHNQKLRRFFTTYQPGGFFDFSGVPGVQPGDVVSAQNFFQLKSSGDAGVTINQLIFSGSYFVGLEAANAFKDFSRKNTKVTQTQLVQDVMKAYYAVLINRERIYLFESNISRLDSLLKNTVALHENGFAESIDVDRIRVQLNNLNTERSNFNSMQETILGGLKLLMNYPQEQPLTVLGSIEDVNVETSSGAYTGGFDYQTRPDFLVMESSHKLQSLNLKNTKAGVLPTIGAFANMGYATQSPTIGGIFKTNSQFKDDGTAGPDKWYTYSLFGVSLNWSLFNGGAGHQRVQQQKLALSKIENNFRAVKSGIDFEIKQASIMYDNAIKTLEMQKQNMDLASNVARVTKIKYEQGVGSNLEVTDAESTLKQSQINYYNSMFDAMIAKVNLDKAYGRIEPPTTEGK